MHLFSRFAVSRFAVVLCGLGAALSARASTIYVTNFTKTNNIYTSLDQEFPNTGPGVPGSGVGVPNSSFIFNPAVYTPANYVAGSDLANNGVNFDLTSNAAGHDFYDTGAQLAIPLDLSNVTSVSFLVACYSVVAGSDGLLSLYFTGTSGSNLVQDSVTDMQVPDFNDINGTTINRSYTSLDSTSPNVFDQTVFVVDNVGGGGTGNSSTGSHNDYALTEITVDLGSDYAGGELTDITFYPNAYTPILLGITAQTGSAAPEPSTWGLMLTGLALSGAGLVRRRKRGRRGSA